MTISPSFEQLKLLLNGKSATGTNERGDHTFEVHLFEKIIQKIEGWKDIRYSFFDNNLDKFWNANTSTLMMPGGRDGGERMGEIKFVAVDNSKKHNTISVVTEPDKVYYKMTWFYDRSYLTTTV